MFSADELQWRRQLSLQLRRHIERPGQQLSAPLARNTQPRPESSSPTARHFLVAAAAAVPLPLLPQHLFGCLHLPRLFPPPSSTSTPLEATRLELQQRSLLDTVSTQAAKCRQLRGATPRPLWLVPPILATLRPLAPPKRHCRRPRINFWQANWLWLAQVAGLDSKATLRPIT